MKIEFDEEKSAKNALDRGLPFDAVLGFDFSSAMVVEDIRHPYPETRFIAIGYIDDRLHVLCFTPVYKGIRIISLRRANAREVKRYAKATTH